MVLYGSIMSFIFNIVCIVGPEGPQLNEVVKQVKKPCGDHPFGMDLNQMLEAYFAARDHGHAKIDSMRQCHVTIMQAVKLTIEGHMPLIKAQPESERNFFITGFPFTIRQALFIRHEWPKARMIIYFLWSAKDGESWEEGKRDLREGLHQIADEFHVL